MSPHPDSGYARLKGRAWLFAALLIALPLTATASVLDVDNDGSLDALTDGSLIVRYLLGYRDAALTEGAVDTYSVRTEPALIVQHEAERKTITQLIKVVAYRSERCLASLLEPFFARHDDEVHAFLKTVFQLPGDILPDHERQELRVRLYGLANHRSQQALIALCECLNTQQVVYPGTELRLVFEAIQSH